MFKIPGTGCYDIYAFILSPKDGLPEFTKFKFRQVSSFTCIWNKDSKVFLKNTMAHNFAYMINLFVFHYIWQLWLLAYKNYSKFCTRKCKKQHYVYCDNNDISMVYINSNMALLRVRNQEMIICNKVLDNRARLGHHQSTYKIPCKKQPFRSWGIHKKLINLFCLHYPCKNTEKSSYDNLKLIKRLCQINQKILKTSKYNHNSWKALQLLHV